MSSPLEVVQSVLCQLKLAPLDWNALRDVPVQRRQRLIKYASSNPLLVSALYNAFDWQACECLDYPVHVKFPMHLNHCIEKSYDSFDDSIVDLLLVFCNAVIFNPVTEFLHVISRQYLEDMHAQLLECVSSPTREEFLATEETIAFHAPRILIALITRDELAIFHHPVDKMVAGYYETILHPISLSCIWKRMESGVYMHWDDFWADVNLMWSNALQFNVKDNEFVAYTEQIKVFCKGLRQTFYSIPNGSLQGRGITVEMSEGWLQTYQKSTPCMQKKVEALIVTQMSWAFENEACPTIETLAFAIPHTLFFRTLVYMRKH